MGRSSNWDAQARGVFLARLAVEGNVRRACAATGLTVASAYALRGRDADFAGEWAAALARWRAARAERMQARLPAQGLCGQDYRVRHDGWTPLRQRAFLRALSETGCVRDACARVRISSTSAYRLRRAAPEFARAWRRALAQAVPTIEQAAFERAVKGWDDVVTRDGVELSRRRRYSDGLLRLLLQREQAAAVEAGDKEGLVERARAAARAAGGIFATRATEDETNAALMQKLDALYRHRAAQAAERGRIAREGAGGRPLLPARQGEGSGE
ncbi:hypothetical protein ACG3SL_01900 [Sphingomonas sp. CJ20]